MLQFQGIKLFLKPSHSLRVKMKIIQISLKPNSIHGLTHRRTIPPKLSQEM